MIQLEEILNPESIKIDQHPICKMDLFDILLDLTIKSGNVTDAELLKCDLLIRENIQSTGLGYGLALPHVASDGITKLTISCVICPDGVDYNAIDSAPVYVAFLIAQPEHGKTREYLHILATLSRLFRGTSIMPEILAARDAGEVYSLLVKKPIPEIC